MKDNLVSSLFFKTGCVFCNLVINYCLYADNEAIFFRSWPLAGGKIEMFEKRSMYPLYSEHLGKTQPPTLSPKNDFFQQMHCERSIQQQR